MAASMASASRITDYQAPWETVWAAAEQAMKDCGFKKIQPDASKRSLSARAPISMATFGDKVRVEISEIAKGTVRVNARSATRTLQLYDWGKNRKNLARFFQALDGRVRAKVT
jgi:hypothetical protein